MEFVTINSIEILLFFFVSHQSAVSSEIESHFNELKRAQRSSDIILA